MKLKKFNELYNKIILESIKDGKISLISKNEIKKIIDNNEIENENSRIKNFNNLTKLFYSNDIDYYVVKDSEGKIRACAGCAKRFHNSYYINELFSFRKGYGSLLLHYLLSLNYDIIYLNSNWEEEESLNGYYRRPEFGLTETTYKRSDDKIVHYFYLNKKLNEEELQEFIKDIMI